jgi:osmotically-inducible protein OsmY
MIKNVPPAHIGDDEQLAKNVHTFLVSRIPPAANRVRVDANDGTITLLGMVESFYFKQLWLSGTQQVAGVRRVVDRIDVASC